jgi:hypothetical protein
MNWLFKKKARLSRAELINAVLRYFLYCDVSEAQVIETLYDKYKVTITFTELESN